MIFPARRVIQKTGSAVSTAHIDLIISDQTTGTNKHDNER